MLRAKQGEGMLVGERWASSSLSTQVFSVDPRTLLMSGAGVGRSSLGSVSHSCVPPPQQASGPLPGFGAQVYSHMRSRSQRASHLSFISFLL